MTINSELIGAKFNLVSYSDKLISTKLIATSLQKQEGNK